MKLLKPLKKFAKMIQNEKDLKIKVVRSGHGEEFQNELLEKFCEENDIMHNVKP